MIDLMPDTAVRPEERFLDKLFAIMRDARQFITMDLIPRRTPSETGCGSWSCSIGV
jgi:hypothetical protein